MSAGQIIEVDPAALTIALNVRTDTKVDKEFVASIKELGILQPPMVVGNGSGYDVVLGQRRVLASVEAGLKTIPVYLVEKSEADAARVVDQLTENEQRQHLSESELVGGYKQLALFGLSPAQIAKKVARPRKSIDTALAIADNERATSALDEGVTLDQAAVIVEFTDDKAAVKRLVDSAVKGDFDHTVKDLRDKREYAEEEARLFAELASEKVVTIAGTRQSWETPALEGHKLDRLERFGKPGKPTVPLEPSDVKKKGVLAADVARGYFEGERTGYWPVKRYWLVDPETSGFERLQYEQAPPRDLSPEEQAELDEREARFAREREERDALNAASTVRIAWVKEFLQRKSLPADALAFVATVAARLSVEADQDTFDLLGAPLSEEQLDSSDEVDAEELLTRLAGRVGAEKFLIAAALSRCEDIMNLAWRRDDVAGWYLPVLDSWGYGMSQAELALLVAEVEAA